MDCIDELKKSPNLPDSLVKKAVDKSYMERGYNWRETGLEDALSFKSFSSLKRTFKKRSAYKKILMAFSIRLNLTWILRGRSKHSCQTCRSKESFRPVECLFAIKFLTMVWVIVGHTGLFLLLHSANAAQFVRNYAKEFQAQVVLNASLSVDTFFFISGFLVSYVWSSQARRNPGIVCNPWKWLLFYLHRFVRLIPAYAFTLGFTMYLLPHISHGPDWDEKNMFGATCNSSDWWKHLLFVTNFFPSPCLPWMWFLSVEMQLFLLTPILLLIFWYLKASWGNVL